MFVSLYIFKKTKLVFAGLMYSFLRFNLSFFWWKVDLGFISIKTLKNILRKWQKINFLALFAVFRTLCLHSLEPTHLSTPSHLPSLIHVRYGGIQCLNIKLQPGHLEWHSWLMAWHLEWPLHVTCVWKIKLYLY